MAKTINLKQLNGDWIVNNAVGTERIWTRGIYSIVYSDNIFNTGERGWIVKQTDGVEIFAFKTDGDPWSSERTIIWNPNASGYTEDSTANLNVKTIENDYLVDGAGTNSYNGLYQYQADLSFNGKNVYVDGNNYLFYSALLSKWVISNSLNDNGIFAYSGNLDETWYVQEEGVSPAPSVIKYLPYMNVKSENIKTGVHVGDVEGQFTSDATATASHIMKGQSAYVKGKKIQGSIEESTPSTIDNEVTIPTGIISEQKKITVGTKLQSRTYKPSNQEQVIISSNTYITGNQIIEGDANLISENIKKGVSIFGVNGSLQQIENEGSVQSTKLLFRLPWIDNEEYYHLFIDFSESNDFSNVEVFNTKDNIEMFKIFTGLGIVDLPSTGINYIFSEKILQLNIADISSSYKYFRFHWTNDEGETFGEYDYGNRESAVQVYGNKQATKLLFRLPQIGNEEYYHLSIQFSESDDFSNVEVFNTKDNMEMFKVFTGLGIVDLPTVYDEEQQKYVSAGINYLFSEKILCMDIRDVEYSYKNFRFHWSNDNCETFGEYDYGNVNANMSALGQVNQKVDFYKCASVDTVNKTWTGYKAALTDGVYAFEETVTDGLPYGSGFSPVVGEIYNSEATIQVTRLYTGADPTLLFFAPMTKETDRAETGQLLTTTGTITYDGGFANITSNGNITSELNAEVENYTIAFWVKKGSFDNYNGFFTLNNGEYKLLLDKYFNDMRVLVYNSAFESFLSSSFTNEQWTHYVLVFSDDKVSLYVNGELVSEIDYDQQFVITQGCQLIIGKGDYELGGGYMKDFRIYEGSKSLAEIEYIMNLARP